MRKNYATVPAEVILYYFGTVHSECCLTHSNNNGSLSCRLCSFSSVLL